MYNGPLLFGFNVAIKGLKYIATFLTLKGQGHECCNQCLAVTLPHIVQFTSGEDQNVPPRRCVACCISEVERSKIEDMKMLKPFFGRDSTALRSDLFQVQATVFQF